MMDMMKQVDLSKYYESRSKLFRLYNSNYSETINSINEILEKIKNINKEIIVATGVGNYGGNDIVATIHIENQTNINDLGFKTITDIMDYFVSEFRQYILKKSSEINDEGLTSYISNYENKFCDISIVGNMIRINL